jgi:hypothetical protein
MRVYNNELTEGYYAFYYKHYDDDIYVADAQFFHNNIVQGGQKSSKCAGRGISFYNNLFLVGLKLQADGGAAGTTPENATNDNVLEHNYLQGLILEDTDYYAQLNTIKNNYFDGSLRIFPGNALADDSTNTVNYNLYSATSVWTYKDNVDIDFATWKGLDSQDANSLQDTYVALWTGTKTLPEHYRQAKNSPGYQAGDDGLNMGLADPYDIGAGW